MKTHTHWLLVSLAIVPSVSFAVCQESTSTLQQQCLKQEAQERAEQQREAQQEAQERAQQQREAQQRAQQQQDAQREAQQRAQQQQDAQREAQQRAQQQAQQRANQQPAIREKSTTDITSYTEPSRNTVPRESGYASVNGSTSRSNVTSYNSTQHAVVLAGHQALPSGTVTRDTRGQSIITTADQRRYEVRPNGTLANFRAKGENASFFPSGQIRSLHTSSLEINRGVHGERSTIVRGPDHRMIVSYGARAGYVQRSLTYRGHLYAQRTYVLAGRVITRNYTAYTLGGFSYYSYVPTYYYAPGYYSWLATPWSTTGVRYDWDWPWYASDTGYFNVYPYYASPTQWLADYVLGAALQTAYLIETASGQTQTNDATGEVYAVAPSPVTSDLKQQLQDDIRDQITIESTAAQNQDNPTVVTGLQSVLKPNQLFITDTPLNVVTDDNLNCTLSVGDVLKLALPPEENNPTAVLTVSASRQSDCPWGAEVQVALGDIQDMYNTYRAHLADGMQALTAHHVGGALPTSPAAGSQLLAGPPADPANVVALLSNAQTQSDQTEASLKEAVFSQ